MLKKWLENLERILLRWHLLLGLFQPLKYVISFCHTHAGHLAQGLYISSSKSHDYILRYIIV